VDAESFDTLTRSLSAPRSRRAALRAAAAGGLLSALGFTRAEPEARAAERGTCVVAFAAQVLQGPSIGTPLVPNAARAGELRGDLRFSLSASGNLDNAALTLPDGTQLPVVGQATGPALEVRIELAPRTALVAIGVGEQEMTACQGAIDGIVSGPQVGDLGDWHAAASQQAGGAQSKSNSDKQAKQTNRDTTNQGGQSGQGGGTQGAGGASDEATGSTPKPPKRQGGGSAPNGPSGSSGSSGGSGATGASRTPPCSSGQTDCNGTCVDPANDPDHCGGCGTSCAVEEVCVSGACTTSCPSGLTACAGSCVDLLSEPFHCTPGDTCVGGRCSGGAAQTQASCGPGLTDCGTGSCVDLLIDPANCGICGSACGPDVTCINGVCTLTCPAGQSPCNGACVDYTSDVNNCSGCAIVCPDGQVCVASLCSFPNAPSACVTNLTPCGTGCVDLMADPGNCGVCGNVCSGTRPACVFGACTAQECPSGQTFCPNGLCHDLSSDANNCGTCGNVCTGGDVCLDSQCITPVGPAPQTCVQLGEVCDANPCCLGECVTRQDAPSICMCAADGEECIHQGTGGCCSGQPCNDNDFCGTCSLLGATCASDGDCCRSTQYLALCCFDSVSLTTVCTDVTATGVCPGEAPAQTSCPAGQTLCDTFCTDLMTDPFNCGACANSCGLGGTCSGGVCGVAPPAPLNCPEGQTDCGGYCADLNNDPRDCGFCGSFCIPPLIGDATCGNGQCNP
jgi:hypothetical protein